MKTNSVSESPLTEAVAITSNGRAVEASPSEITAHETELSALKEQIKGLQAEKKKVCEAANSLLNKLQEVLDGKDFRTVMAISSAQGFTYKGPWIIDEVKSLVVAIQEVSKPEQKSP